MLHNFKKIIIQKQHVVSRGYSIRKYTRYNEQDQKAKSQAQLRFSLQASMVNQWTLKFIFVILGLLLKRNVPKEQSSF